LPSNIISLLPLLLVFPFDAFIAASRQGSNQPKMCKSTWKEILHAQHLFVVNNENVKRPKGERYLEEEEAQKWKSFQRSC